MLTAEKKNSIGQAKMNALCGKFLHEKYLKKFRDRNILVDILTIIVPVLYVIPRYLLKGQPFIEGLWEVLAGLLLVVALLKIVCKWQEKAEAHSHLRRSNIGLAREADSLLHKADTASNENADWFLKLAASQDEQDGDLLPQVELKDRQEAYREALKQIIPGNVDIQCPSCYASPWKFTSGECQLCGNTPIASPL